MILRLLLLLSALSLSACRVTITPPPACCSRPCTDDSQCIPSLWQICQEGCCTCVPPDGGTCPDDPVRAAVLPEIDGWCP